MDAAADEGLCERPMPQAHSGRATGSTICSVRVTPAEVPSGLTRGAGVPIP
jgi:hypothetical protein